LPEPRTIAGATAVVVLLSALLSALVYFSTHRRSPWVERFDVRRQFSPHDFAELEHADLGPQLRSDPESEKKTDNVERLADP
jgi:hypothetical protein